MRERTGSGSRAARLLAAVLTAVAFAAGAAPGFAQAPVQPLPSVAIPPVTILLPNYNSIPVGEFGSLEGGAYMARVQDSSATWFNPAGLARAATSSVSGSAGTFQLVSLLPQGLGGQGGSFQQLPAAVGFLAKQPLGLERWTGGFQVTSTANWNASADAQGEFTTPGGIDRGTYSNSSSFTGWIGSVAVGYDASPKLHVGGSFDLQRTDASSAAAVSEQYRTATGLSSSLVEGHASASAYHVRLSAGFQYALSGQIHVAAMVRTRGLECWTSGSQYLEGVTTESGTTTTASIFEPDADVTFRVPFEVRMGVAYVGPRAQVEVNVTAYDGAGVYNGFTPSRPLVVVTDSGALAPPIRQEFPRSPTVLDSRAVVNVAIGGQYNLSRSGAWKLHGGFSTDRSPVGPDDMRFTRVHMQAWTAGFSGSTKFLLGSFGVRYEAGESAPIALRRLASGDLLETTVKVKYVGFVYSFTLRF